jgi:hypothetical protein
MSDRVKKACETNFAAYKYDCGGFARAVAGDLGVPLEGLADQIVATLRAGGQWLKLTDGVAAARAAAAGKLVLCGLKGAEQAKPDPHGHVVVVVDGPLAHGAYPSGYWGSLAGSPGSDQTINWAWTPEDRDRVSYAQHDIAPES